jgi:DNA replication protein DnaC
MSCPLCNGSGWKHIEQDGRTAVTRCDCWRQAFSQRLLSNAGIPPRYQRCELSRFVTYGNEKLVKAVAQSRLLVEKFPVVDKGLFFLGPPGVGKTHLAAAILRELILRNGVHGLFAGVPELLRAIRNTYNPDVPGSEADVLQPVLRAELLVLDDIGKEKTSEWVLETLNLIIDARYNGKRVTIITSNFDVSEDDTDPDGLQARVGFRIFSRVKEMCETLHLDGADYRDLPTNGGDDELKNLYHQRVERRKLPTRSKAQARVATPAHISAELKWAGGKIERR